MNTTALIMMVSVEATVIFLTGYFFYKVLTSKPKEGDDLEGDDLKE